MKRFAPLLLAPLLTACAPTRSADVVIFADSHENAERLIASVEGAEEYFEGAVDFQIRDVVITDTISLDGPASDMLANGHGSDKFIPVYLMDEIKAPTVNSAAGVAWYGGGCEVVVGIRRGQQSNAKLMAHELGHIFALGHEDHDHNVMNTRLDTQIAHFSDDQMGHIEDVATGYALEGCEWIR